MNDDDVPPIPPHNLNPFAVRIKLLKLKMITFCVCVFNLLKQYRFYLITTTVYTHRNRMDCRHPAYEFDDNK